MMTLKSIELFGFKSFGKKSNVSFDTPITSIVGPNGSGKSNIVEAIRFVLGEQSIKSLRSKGGVDLIYKGSKSLPSSSRASVSITFDNSKKIFSFTNSGLGISVDYDEVTISRTVYPDGVNKYSINNTEVRLKDVIDLLASVNIGSSGHHIISQGEADRVLNASNRDRRAMIEDALGLKVFQYRILESERKLMKTVDNMKEVGISRREVAPHLNFLKKQVSKVEKSYELRTEIEGLYKSYFSSENKYINDESNRLLSLRSHLDTEINSLSERILEVEKNKTNDDDKNVNQVLVDLERDLKSLRIEHDEISRKLGRIEGVIEGINRELNRAPQIKENIVTDSQWRSVVSNVDSYINECLQMSDLESIFSILRTIKNNLSTLQIKTQTVIPTVDENIEKEKQELLKSKDELSFLLQSIKEKENTLLEMIEKEKEKEYQKNINQREIQNTLFDLQRQKNEKLSDLHSLVFQEEKLNLIKNSFENELVEASVLVGQVVLSFVKQEPESILDRSSIDDLRRRIERIKIKLEDSGISNAGEIMKEYQDTIERDSFLEKEINDLQKSVDDLHLLIVDLKESLDIKFKEGVLRINEQFQEFFSLMFGGGSAFLSIVMEHKKTKKNKDEDLVNADYPEAEEKDENEIGFERGIEINVSLPQKKVKDIHMLSGGERSLTSIALLFAISQVNPPPFLVLDETDAALDEANSRKYGNMLENLAHFSQLVVVTHNRETMSRAQVLYGVTVGADGCSKLLSIKLEDANVYAK